MGRCFKLYRCMDLYWHCFFFLLLVSITGEVSGRLVASWLQKSEMENEWKFWLKMIFFKFSFHSPFRYTSKHLFSYIYSKLPQNMQYWTKIYFFFSFLAKCILVLLAPGEKSSKLLADSNRFPSFKPLFSKFLSRFLIKLATSNNSNF